MTSFDYTSTPGTTKVTDPKGNITLFRYQDGFLVSKVVASGSPQQAEWVYRYDPATLGRTAVIDPLGNATTSTYDTDGNRKTETDPLGNTTRYEYNALGQIISVEEPRRVAGTAIVRGATYDSAGNVRTTSAPLLDDAGLGTVTATTTYLYEDALHPGDVTSVTDPNNITKSFTYDSFGHITAVTDPPTPENPGGNRTTTTYNTATGWVLTTTAPAGYGATGHTTTYVRDLLGRPKVARDPMWTAADSKKHRTATIFDADGNLTRVVDGVERMTTMSYDAAGQLREVLRHDGTVLTTDYWPDGTVRRKVDGAGKATEYGYDAAARVTSIKDPLGRTTTLGYDRAGNMVATTDPLLRTTTRTYDAANRLTGIAYSDGVTPGVSLIEYDANGQRVRMLDGVGESSWAYDSLHRLTSATVGSTGTVGYDYDLGGRLARITYPGAFGAVTYEHDDANRVSAIVDWGGRRTTFSYDRNSNLVGKTFPNGTSETVTLDPTNSVTAIRHGPTLTPALSFASFGYVRDGASRVTSVTSTGGSPDNHTYGYDPLSRLADVDVAAYEYDAADNLADKLDGTALAYDDANQLVSSALPTTLVGTASAGDNTTNSLTMPLPPTKADGDQAIVAVSVPGNRSVTTPVGYTLVRTYRSASGGAAAKLLVFRRTLAAADTSVVVAFPQTHAKSAALAVYRNVDPAVPVDVTPVSAIGTAKSSITLPSVTPTVRNDRLLLVAGAFGTAGSWTPPAGMAATAQQAGGNTDVAILDQSLPANTPTGTRTATHSTTTNIAGALIALRPIATRFGYDASGNRSTVAPAGGVTTSLTYDQADRLVSPGGAVTYAYNADGLRTAKTVGPATTTSVWDTNRKLPQLLVDGTKAFVYGPDGLPLTQIEGPTAHWFHRDQLGSTRALTDNTTACGGRGCVAARYTYDSYGALTGVKGPASTPLRFAGQYADAETGNYYLRARHYDPTTGQFLTRDPLEPATGTPYAYAGNDPLNYTDPTGLFRIPGTDWCVDIADPNCVTAVEGQPNDVADFAAGVLSVNPITASTDALGLTDTSQYADECSGYFTAGQWSMTAVDVVATGGGGVSAWRALHSGRGIGVGNIARVARHQAHRAMPELSGGAVRQANWLKSHHAFRTHWHTVWRGVRSPGGM